jgi:DNA mismatch repair protein MutH
MVWIKPPAVNSVTLFATIMHMAQVTPVDYDLSSPKSLLQYAKGLSGKTLAEVVDMTQIAENISNKGDLGNMVEKYYYRYQPDNTTHKPDFPQAGVELKTTGVLKRSDGSYRAKERLVLTMINYANIVSEQWDSSSLLEKCRLMLILFYLYEKDVAVFNRRFVLDPLLYVFPPEDMLVIKRDWQIIQQKIIDGKAHELSEGDTYYLGACRKGSGGASESLKKQPFSAELAKSRAFSLKASYMNRVIQGHAQEVGQLDISPTQTIEDATYAKFKPYIGKTIDEISRQLDFYKKGKNDKGFYRNLTMRMLGSAHRIAPELDKAEVELKTIRVNKNWMPAESMSFPTFKYMEIINQDWEDSSFFAKIERKFLFVIFREDDNGTYRFEVAKYWNMPYADRQEAERVWTETKRRVSIDATNLPKASESHVAHVRPKGKNASDTLPTPQGQELLKKCFWLNRGYIADIIKSLV